MLEHVGLEADHLCIDRDPVLGVPRADRLWVFACEEAIMLRFRAGQGPWFYWDGRNKVSNIRGGDFHTDCSRADLFS